MKVLVTGGMGFIGSHLTDRLIQGKHQVVVFDEKQGQDINDFSQLKRVFDQHNFDVVAHLAAKAGVRQSFAQPQLYFQTNVGGTLNLLECLKQSPQIRLVFTSSSSVYGNNAAVPFKETETNLVPVSPYAASKLAAELACRIYAEQYGIKTTILRLFTVYGPRNRPDMAAFTFTRDIMAGRPIKLFGQETERDFTYVDDIVAGIVKAIKKPFGLATINLGNSAPIPIRRFISLIEAVAGKKAKIETTGLPAGDVVRTWADVTQAKQLLGWQPQMSIATGVAKLVNWFKLTQT